MTPLARARGAAWALLLCILGCKNDNDELRKQALALRACKDKACVSATRATFADLWNQHDRLPAADARFFAELGAEISSHELTFDRRSPARTKGPGFSIVLPAGWETRAVGNKPNAVLGAAKGSSLETMTVLAVMRAPKQVELGTQPACDAAGAQQAETFAGKLERSKLFDIGGGSACVVRVTYGKQEALITLVPDGANMFYAMCHGPRGDKTMMEDCPVIFTSWKAEP